MPPKKRDRDIDDEELDKEELKAMLRASIDREAEHVVKLEEQQKALDRALLDRVNLYVCQPAENRKSLFVYYPNPHLLRQATAANMRGLFDLESEAGLSGGRDETLLFLKLSSCSDLVKVFENGVPVDTELADQPFEQSTNSLALFSVIIFAPKGSDKIVGRDNKSSYFPVAARSHWVQFNRNLGKHLEQSAPFPRRGDQMRNLLHRRGTHFFSQHVQTLVEAAAFDAVINDIWVPDPTRTAAGGVEVAVKCKLDLNRMLLISHGDEASLSTIGFSRNKLPNGTEFDADDSRVVL